MTADRTTQTPYELTIEELRARRGTKWHRFPPDVLPAWVAEMDFAVAEPIQEAIVRTVARGDYGYSVGFGVRDGEDGLAAAFRDRMRDRFGWTVHPDPTRVVPTAELVQAIFALVTAFSDPGDGVVNQTPIYPPFLQAIVDTGRRLVDNPLADDGTRFVLDLDGLRRAIDLRTRILLLCNPHNPSGRVFERDELLAIGRLAVERGLVIVADEIHADLIYTGRPFVPLGSLGPEITERTITITSATKSFNIPGLRCSLMYFGSDRLRERFRRRIPDRLLGQLNMLGIDATVAAWRQAQPWLDAIMPRLRDNRERVARFVADELPGVKHYPPEGSYLAWLDCAGLDLPTTPFQFFLERARVGLSDGSEFGPRSASCVRLNFATSPPILDQILARMATAVRTR